MSLAAYSDTPWVRKTAECECGNPKSTGAVACDRCTFLDGRHSFESCIIEQLRICPELTTQDLARATNRHDTQVTHTIRRMLADGRIRRRWSESDAKEILGRGRYGGWQRMVRSGGGCWVYSLFAETVVP